MEVAFTAVMPVLPAVTVEDSLAWWVDLCGFTVEFRDSDPAGYAGIAHGEIRVHLARMDDATLARTVGNQTMIRFAVADIDAFYAEFQQRGGKIHPNGALQKKPWGTREFGAIDPCGVCVTFQQA